MYGSNFYGSDVKQAGLEIMNILQYDSDEEEKYVTRDPSYQPASEVSSSRPKRKRNEKVNAAAFGSDDDDDDIDSGDSFEEALEGQIPFKSFYQLPIQALAELNGKQYFLTLKDLWQINARFA